MFNLLVKYIFERERS